MIRNPFKRINRFNEHRSSYLFEARQMDVRHKISNIIKKLGFSVADIINTKKGIELWLSDGQMFKKLIVDMFDNEPETVRLSVSNEVSDMDEITNKKKIIGVCELDEVFDTLDAVL